MKNKIILQKHLNNKTCVTLPKDESCEYLKEHNYLSEYKSDYAKQEVLNNLGVLDLIDKNNNSIDNKLNSYVTLRYLTDNFVKKEDIYNIDEEGDEFDIVSDYSDDNSNSVVDDELCLTSTNPLLNRVITRALAEKLSYEDLVEVLKESPIQPRLIAGSGINIKDNVISSTLDTNPFAVVDILPETNINPNKIYLLYDLERNTYVLYRYIIEQGTQICPDNLTGGKWIKIGDASLGIDLSTSELDDKYQPIGDYVSSYALKRILKDYVKKSDVYTPDLWGNSESSDDDTSYSTILYESSFENGVKTNVTVGNINAGTDVALLKGKTISELLDMILFKEIWPTSTPKHTIVLNMNTNIRKVGSTILTYNVVAEWNQNVLPINNILYEVSDLFVEKSPKYNGNSVTNYPCAGTHIVTLNYSYPSGNYEVTSNFGNTKNIAVSSNVGTITKTVEVTHPWFVNNLEQSVLVPVNQQYSTNITLRNQPSIAIPGDLSTCNITANLGLGFMDVEWPKTIIYKNGIPYSVWTKPDLYLQDIEHQILFKIMFDTNN